MSEIQVADLFCGPGGMSIGFSEHFDVVLAIDHKPDPCNTYQHNLSGVVRQRDIRNISGVQKDFDGISGTIAGPPCKPFSKINTRKDPGDPRQHLWKDFMRIVEETNVDFFLLENVPTVFVHIKKAILKKARQLGYFVTYGVLEASDYGVPQARKRWIVIGTKRPFSFPEPTRTRLTVKEAFQGIEDNSGFFNTRCKTLEKFDQVPFGKWVPISAGRFRNAIRLAWDQPAPTIVNISKVYMIHPEENRVISETEAAVLQDFPGDYEFHGARRSRCQQIADAAPPTLMRELAAQIYRTQYKGRGEMRNE